MLARDIRWLRGQQWRFVSAAEATDFVYGRSNASDAQLALITTDDGHEEDAEFRETLRREGCPGTTFVNVGRMSPAWLDWYRQTHSDEWSVQDHGQLHRRHFVSGHLTGVFHGQKVGGLSHLILQVGAPILASSGELASPRFDPHPEAISLAAEWARSEAVQDIASERWMTELSERLQRSGLAYRWRGRTYLTGTLEAQNAFERRVKREVKEGRLAFEKALGRAPTLFAYPWWQSSSVSDRELAASGYAVTFAGTDRVQGAAMSPYSVPRVVMDAAKPRPVDLCAVGERSRRDWRAIRGQVERAAKRMLGVI
jgi:peptidoglycan/xylan/chitin deacetylase (PgdA/CDA1 family)